MAVVSPLEDDADPGEGQILFLYFGHCQFMNVGQREVRQSVEEDADPGEGQILVLHFGQFQFLNVGQRYVIQPHEGV